MATETQLRNLEKARAARAAKKENSITLTKDELQAMIAAAVVAAQKPTERPAEAPRTGEDAVRVMSAADRQNNADAIRTAPVEIPGDGRQRPGTRVTVGKDRFGQDIYGRIEWRREDIEGNYVWSYPKVTFTPSESMVVSPHGIKYQLRAEEEITVPSIVKDIYDQARATRRANANAHPPLSPDEDHKVSVAAVDSGLGISRVFRIGYGFPEPEEAA